MPATPITGERDLWRIWEERRLPAGLRTRDGRRLRILFPGVPNTGPGPDFTGALFALDEGDAIRGDVELHLKATSWAAHGHHQDPRYVRVRLHVVLLDDGGSARTLDDTLVPILVLGPLLEAPPIPVQPAGSGPCLWPHAPRPAPADVREAVLAASLDRFAARAARWEGEWSARSEEDCIVHALISTVGLGRNAEACAALADAIDGTTLESLLASAGDQAPALATAVLLGMAGLLEHARADDRQRQLWAAYRDYWPARALDGRHWQRSRLRPANLPETRLCTVAAVLAHTGLSGFLQGIIALVEQPAVTVPELRVPLTPPGATSGRAWVLEAWTNVLLPLLAGYGNVRARSRLVARAQGVYATLPGGGENQVLERMTAIAGLPAIPRTAIEQQGLLQLWRSHCSIQACATCPLVVRKSD